MQNELVIRTAYDRGFRVDESGTLLSRKGVALKVRTTKAGYYETNVRINNKLHHLPVHRLCAYQKFGDAMFETDCVRHLDGNPRNNHPDNIAIGTISDNAHDIPKERRIAIAKHAVHCNKRTRSDEMARQIQEYYKQVRSFSKTKLKFGISSNGTLFSILKRVV